MDERRNGSSDGKAQGRCRRRTSEDAGDLPSWWQLKLRSASSSSQWSQWSSWRIGADSQRRRPLDAADYLSAQVDVERDCLHRRRRRRDRSPSDRNKEAASRVNLDVIGSGSGSCEDARKMRRRTSRNLEGRQFAGHCEAEFAAVGGRQLAAASNENELPSAGRERRENNETTTRKRKTRLPLDDNEQLASGYNQFVVAVVVFLLCPLVLHKQQQQQKQQRVGGRAHDKTRRHHKQKKNITILRPSLGATHRSAHSAIRDSHNATFTVIQPLAIVVTVASVATILLISPPVLASQTGSGVEQRQQQDRPAISLAWGPQIDYRAPLDNLSWASYKGDELERQRQHYVIPKYPHPHPQRYCFVYNSISGGARGNNIEVPSCHNNNGGGTTIWLKYCAINNLDKLGQDKSDDNSEVICCCHLVEDSTVNYSHLTSNRLSLRQQKPQQLVHTNDYSYRSSSSSLHLFKQRQHHYSYSTTARRISIELPDSIAAQRNQEEKEEEEKQEEEDFIERQENDTKEELTNNLVGAPANLAGAHRTQVKISDQFNPRADTIKANYSTSTISNTLTNNNNNNNNNQLEIVGGGGEFTNFNGNNVAIDDYNLLSIVSNSTAATSTPTSTQIMDSINNITNITTTTSSLTSAISNHLHSMYIELLIVTILSLIILITFFGNVLVCLSVIKVRKLRNPPNYLLISLAISDLCVALAVMPFGLYQAINDKWQLGTVLCNIYVVSDVTSCTASILNLCVISIDRYFAITRPLTYCIKRTTRLMLLLIALVWILACLISVPPLLISGNEYGTPDDPRCEVSQSVYYQLYATLFSFYIPLGVMIFIYYNIYTAAKRVIEAEQRATTGLNINNNQQQQQQQQLPINITNQLDNNNNNSMLEVNAKIAQQKQQQQQQKSASLSGALPPMLSFVNHFRGQSAGAIQPAGAGAGSGVTQSMLNNPVANNNNNNSSSSNNQTINETTASSSLIISSSIASSQQQANQQHHHHHHQQQQKSSVMRERKASITLGVIMSAFTICWLPFFLIALFKPISKPINDLPRAFVLLTLWLGYANSLLNPIIYVTFHHDFRNAFKHLLCFRCMTINEHIRKDEYKSNYGETHYQENQRKLRAQPQHQQQHQFHQNNNNNNHHHLPITTGDFQHQRRPQMEVTVGSHETSGGGGGGRSRGGDD